MERFHFVVVIMICMIGSLSFGETTPLCSIENNPGWSAPGYVLKDHCMYKKNGVWHMIGIKSIIGGSCNDPGNEVTFMHGTSTDLVNWTLEPDVISTVPLSYESDHVWAPSAIGQDGNVLLFYTMIKLEDSTNWQRIGYAVSQNLADWNQQSSIVPLWDPAVFAPWSGWSSPYGGACRDPMVFHDETNSRYIIYYTALHSSWRCVIGAAVSTDLIHWTDAGYVLMADSGGTWGTAQLESPYVVKRNGHYYLFYNHGAPEPPVGTGNGIHWVMSDDPLNFGVIPAGVTDPNPRFLQKVSFELVYGDDAPYSGGEWLFTVCWNLRLGRIDWQGDVPVAVGVDLNAIASSESQYNTSHANQPPVVDAGLDQELNLSISLLLKGNVVDPESDPLIISWTVINAPKDGEALFENSDSESTMVTFTKPGTYILMLTADDGVNDSVFDFIEINVLDDRPKISRTKTGCDIGIRASDCRVIAYISAFTFLLLQGYYSVRIRQRS